MKRYYGFYGRDSSYKHTMARSALAAAVAVLLLAAVLGTGGCSQSYEKQYALVNSRIGSNPELPESAKKEIMGYYRAAYENMKTDKLWEKEKELLKKSEKQRKDYLSGDDLMARLDAAGVIDKDNMSDLDYVFLMTVARAIAMSSMQR